MGYHLLMTPEHHVMVQATERTLQPSFLLKDQNPHDSLPELDKFTA